MDKSTTDIKKRIRDIRAFTLSEALVAVIILLFVTAVVVAGMPAVMRAYDNVVTSSNADVLLSTTMSTLRNELCTASKVEAADSNKALVYYNEANGTMSKISTDGKDILYEMYTDSYELLDDAYKPEVDESGSDESDSNQPTRLMSETVSDKQKKMHVIYDKVTYSNGVITFENLRVTKENGGKTAALRPLYKIRVMTRS